MLKMKRPALLSILPIMTASMLLTTCATDGNSTSSLLPSAGAHGFLLAPTDRDREVVPSATLTSADQAELVLFVDRDCVVCSGAIEQARKISETRKVLIAPITFDRVDRELPGNRPAHEQALWVANAEVFSRVGATGIPFWMGKDGCGQDVRLAGVLLDTDLKSLASSCEI